MGGVNAALMASGGASVIGNVSRGGGGVFGNVSTSNNSVINNNNNMTFNGFGTLDPTSVASAVDQANRFTKLRSGRV